MTPRMRLENVVRRYRQRGSRRSVEVLRVRSLDVSAGEILAVIGPNGSGKSTLLETMAFLHAPEDGRILLDGRDIWADGRSLAARRRCPMLLQRTVLFKSSVLSNTMYGLRARGMNRREADRRAKEVLARVGLEGFAARGHRELSGGEKQRVALARLLALQPETLLLDEPTAHVDHASAERIDDVIRQMQQETGMTVILASHDPRQAHKLADRVVTLFDGELICGTTETLLHGWFRKESSSRFFLCQDDMCLPLSVSALSTEFGQRRPASDVPFQIAIDTECLEVRPSPSSETGANVGRIELVQQYRGRCRVQIRMTPTCTLNADIPLDEYQQLGLNVGKQVSVRIGDGGVRCWAPVG
ncbi:MAG: energy-coupling factor ABC transporter ATP-binding protein [Pirellulaceae bacterium]